MPARGRPPRARRRAPSAQGPRGAHAPRPRVCRCAVAGPLAVTGRPSPGAPPGALARCRGRKRVCGTRLSAPLIRARAGRLRQMAALRDLPRAEPLCAHPQDAHVARVQDLLSVRRLLHLSTIYVYCRCISVSYSHNTNQHQVRRSRCFLSRPHGARGRGGLDARARAGPIVRTASGQAVTRATRKPSSATRCGRG